MIYYLFGSELRRYPHLHRTMHRDRAIQFASRLGWNVTVNSVGEEKDEYDDLNPLYVIEADANGRHLGSMRFLPTTGPTMISDHFSNLTAAVNYRSPLIFECSRFCTAKNADTNTATRLFTASGKLLREFDLVAFVGVFDERMLRLHKKIGSNPEIVGHQVTEDETMYAGIWSNDDLVYRSLLNASGLTEDSLDSALRKQTKSEQKMLLAG